jgi:hypothetical protein
MILADFNPLEHYFKNVFHDSRETELYLLIVPCFELKMMVKECRRIHWVCFGQWAV